MTDDDSTNWRGVARALMASIFDASITVAQKQEIFDGALRQSPKYAATGDTAFESMLINDALRTHEEERDCGS